MKNSSGRNNKRISLFGDITIDLVLNRENGAFSPFVGGSVFNTAVSLKNLGVDVDFNSYIGDDYWGRYIQDYIKDNNLNFNNIKMLKDYKTSVAFAIPEENGDTIYEFYKSVKKVEMNFDLDKCFLFHLGSSFCVIDENDSNIEKIFKLCKENGVLISYDPNYRKKQSNVDNILRNLKNADIVKASMADLKNIFGNMSLESYVEVIRSLGVKLIVITLGCDGALASNKTGTYVTVRVKENRRYQNTIGAGDNFSSGLLYYILKNINKTSLSDLDEEFITKALSFSNEVAGKYLIYKNGLR